MAENTIPRRIVRAMSSREEQDAQTYSFWQSRTTAERMAAIDEIIRDAYTAKGIHLDVQRSDRSVARIQRIQYPKEQLLTIGRSVGALRLDKID
jgi:ribosomal protein S12 methylthiotransferase accessory factor YcaO